MKFVFTAHGVVVANDRIGAFKMANGLIEEIEKRTGQKFTLTVHGPIDHGNEAPRAPAQAGRSAEADAGPGREGPHPGDDFAEDGAEADDGSAEARAEGGGADGLQRAGDGDDAPKRGRGRPRKPRDGDGSAEAPGTAPARSERRSDERNGDAERAGRGEGGGRNGAVGTAQGEGEGRGDRAEGAREPGGRAPAAAGGRGGDQVEAGLTPAEGDDEVVDFNDPEPEVALTMADINRSLTGLFKAMGKGADKVQIGKVLEEVAGVRQPKDVPEEGYAKVIREIDAITALFASGKRKLGA